MHSLEFDDLVVGGAGRRRIAGFRDREIVGGSEEGLSFALEWPEGAVTEGTLRLMLGGVVVWGDEDVGLHNDWAVLLDHLARNWNALRLEQAYPMGRSAAKPSGFARTVATPDLAGLDFLRRHDLAAWSCSSGTPAFYVLREGNLAALECGSEFALQPISDVLRTLAALGDAIADRLRDLHIHPATVTCWTRRGDSEGAEALGWAIGRPTHDAENLVESGTIDWVTADELARDLDEVTAAARMMGPKVRVPAIVGVARSIRTFAAHETPELDLLSVGALTALREHRGEKPHAQGHAVAIWLRQKLGYCDESGRFDIQGLLADWGVPVVDTALPGEIEAVAFWGARHGPGILMEQSSHSNPGKRRATLAHEACHLLVDRGGTLTVADVYGGCVPQLPEKRANAFAPELLLPRRLAIDCYRQMPDLDTTLDGLIRIFEVSVTMAARQLLNYEEAFGSALSFVDRRQLKAICRYPDA